MPVVDAKKEYISWGDVHELVRYLEAGYGGRFKFVMTVACPKGEQYLKQYWELKWCDDALQERPTKQRVLARFPNAGSKTLAGCFYGLLLAADSVLVETYLWSEPSIAVKPRSGLPT